MNFKIQAFRRGFTLMEIMIAVITLGVIASLALSNYNKTIERNYCHNAQMNLLAISNAKIIKDLRSRPSASATVTGISDINNTLNLNINDAKFDYVLNSNVSGNYTAIATRTGGPSYTCTVINTPFSLTCTSGEDVFCPRILR